MENESEEFAEEVARTNYLMQLARNDPTCCTAVYRSRQLLHYQKNGKINETEFCLAVLDLMLRFHDAKSAEEKAMGN